MAHNLLGELLYIDALEIALLLLDEVGRAVEGHAAVVANDASAAVGVGQACDDVCVAGGLDVIVIGREHTLVVGLAVLGEDGLGGGVELIAIGLQRFLYHADASLGEDSALQRLVGLKADHHLAVLVDISGSVGVDALGQLGLGVVDSLLALHLKKGRQHGPQFLGFLRGTRQKTLVACIRLIVGLDEVSYINLVLPV